MTVLKFRPKPKKKRIRRRMLNAYNAMAQKQYSCWECNFPIFPGDYYRREAWVVHKHFEDRKIHISPPCDFFDPPEERKYREEEMNGTDTSSMAA